MKNFVLMAAMTFAANAFSAEKTAIVSINIGDDFESEQTAVLYDNGELVVEQIMLVEQDGVITHDRVARVGKFLSDDVYRDLLNRAISLSDAEIVETHQDYVCMIAILRPAHDLKVRTGHDFDAGWTGEMRTVLTESGCWRHYHAQPASAGLGNAHYLKGAVTVLARQMLADSTLETIGQ